MMRRELFIDGSWRPSSEGREALVRNPATGALYGTTSVAGAADVDAAARSAARAADAWGRTPADERAEVLLRAERHVRERVEDIAAALTQEQGKPLADSRKEVLFGADVLHYYAEEGRRIGGSLRASTRRDVKSVVSSAPVGVVGAIVPWNYPVDLWCWKVAPALAAGCPVVVKPPPQTPFAIAEVVRCLVHAGLPQGTLADLPGDAEAGQALVRHPEIRMVTATASTGTGQEIMRAASDGLKRLSLELGGHAPLVVLEDADMEIAAAAALRRSFSNMGQICISVNRVLVAAPIADDFVTALGELTSGLRLGDGMEDGVKYGPVLDDSVIARVDRHVGDAVGRGGALVTGGRRLSEGEFARGTFYLPTVVDHVPADAVMMQEETYGPAVGVQHLGTDADLLRAANQTPYGLAAYVYSRDLERAWAFADRLEFGMVGVNVNDTTELQAPFGGWKLSGLGRELGPEGLMTFRETRHVRLRITPFGAET